MKVLKVNNGKAYFIVNNSEVEIEKFSRDNLLQLLNDIYENQSKIIFPDDTEINNILNPVEKGVVQQIISKLKDFSENVPQIRNEIENIFPAIESEE